MEKLLEHLRASRQGKGISQDYLAVKLGVSSSTISRWESKVKFPSIDKLFEYASLLDITVHEVLAFSANEPAGPKPVGKIEISAYDKASFKRLVEQQLEEEDGHIKFVTTQLK
ncbi:helix-turn-helix transcriptional regulator [Porphyromonas sp. oral taxon 278]|uniref:helix-turn-helix domain-containing protein n=1 Tax=Porphyromonas sp. oral taxon 278 TaxID=712437 RepID=UPI0025D25931|nr:helix-turn-helix transcriptional regulator [Porphyromonas sp. oral taxon 278]